MNEPGVTMDSGNPIQGVDTPPAEPAGQSAGFGGTKAPLPGYGPNPTAQGVRGYRNLTPDEVELINQLKAMQEAVAVAWANVFIRPETDRRKANIAKTHFEEGFSALVGSIARPHDPFAAALGALERAHLASTTSGLKQSTVEPNSAQPSQDHHPDEGSRA